MNHEIFLTLLFVCTVLTGLFTEAIKRILNEIELKCPPNVLAGFVAVSVSTMTAYAYAVDTGALLTDKMMVYLIALVLLSWLSAMVGYDKVVQAINQIKKQPS